MDHVAILRKSNIKKGDNLLQDILSGAKKIESRWYVNKVAPWDKIKAEEIVYFKESGCPVTAMAKVKKVLQFGNLNKNKLHEIVEKYGKEIAPYTSQESWNSWINKQDKKRYCILIFLSDVKRIEPFEIDKTGYGISSAWLVAEYIENLKKK